ncbi:hypothetical protein LOZ58_003678 [Ophidiomyces ophidiicola]|nr:hypothetical protein LOZ65_005795 [Ophidiomyces ophidiicola]KAI1961189.1 hypothetical protein LOZ58_003678 [Ophidiomyces ophidiicola]
MSYVNDSSPFNDNLTAPFHQPIGFGPPVSFSPYTHPVGQYLVAYPPSEVAAFPPFYPGHSGPFEDYEEYVENLSRPRLTKEQVETLEAQFQAHPKPTSNVKRQLAVQTNLTLPRVANWFQNRRAKEKQQKRQREFERIQALAKSDQAENEILSTDLNLGCELDNGSPSEEIDRTTTPSAEGEAAVSPQQTKATSDIAISQDLPKPVDLAVKGAAFLLPKLDSDLHDNHSDCHTSIPGSTDQTPDYPTQSTPSEINGRRLSNVSESQSASPPPVWVNVFNQDGVIDNQTGPQQHLFDASGPWLQDSNISEHSLFGASYSSTCGSRSIPECPSFPTDRASFVRDFLTADIASELSHMSSHRRESYRSEPIEFPNHTTPHRTIALARDISGGSFQSQQMISPNDHTFPRLRDKKLDLAARRKRPRPPAIGVGAPNRSLIGPSSMSPTTRAPSLAVSHSLRHVKSSQALGSSLSPKYAGVRKISAPLRSPLGMPAALDVSGASSSNSDFVVSPLITTTIPPHTPLTPDDLQYLFPPTPNDAQYCHSPTDELRCARLFPASYNADGHSPPRTPYHPENALQQQCNSLSSHLSASSFGTTFESHSLPASQDSMANPTWSETNFVTETLSVPDIHVPKSTQISPITQSIVEQAEVTSRDNWPTAFSSFSRWQSKELGSTLSDHASASLLHLNPEFMIEEFPNQQTRHDPSQLLISEKPKVYTFTNQTPNDF